MSLLCWYPLDGNLEDYSGNLGNMTGSWTTDDSGKIGKCYKKNGTMTIPISPKEIGPGYTFTFWIYTDPTTTGTTSSLFGIDQPSENRSAFSFFQYPTRNDFHWSLKGLNGVDTGVLKDGWTHVTIVCTSTTIYRYYNGILKGSSTGTPNFDDNTNIQVTGLAGTKLNDIRIYDEELSLKEIKEIAKAKILHYNFNECRESVKNLLNVNSINVTSNGGVTHATLNETCPLTGRKVLKLSRTVNVAGYNGLWIPSLEYKPSTKYTMTLWYKIPKDMDKEIRLYLPEYNGSTLIDYRHYITLKAKSSGWKRISTTWTSDSSCTNTPRCQLDWTTAASTTEDCIYIGGIQLEEHDHGTPYTDTTRLDIVSDSSGFKHDSVNMTLTTCPKWTDSGNVVGTGMYKYTAKSGQRIECNNFNDITDAITVSVWAKYEASSSTDRPLVNKSALSDLSDGWALWDGYSQDFRWDINGSNGSTQSIINGTWRHFVGTYDSTTGVQKLYMDGNLIRTVNKTAGTKILTNTAPLRIGYSVRGTASMSGNIADVQIYATALSDTDVKELFQSKGSVAKNGKVFINEIIESTDRIKIVNNIKAIVSTNQYRAIYTGSPTGETDISRLVQSDNTLGETYLEGDVYISSLSYLPSNFEYTLDNNDKGFDMVIDAPSSGWKVGWNHFYQKVRGYVSQNNTNWSNMNRLELYYKGDIPTATTTEYLQYKDVYLVKRSDGTDIGKSNVNKKGQLITKEIIENNYRPSLLDYSTWALGSTLPSGWSNNGSTTENTRVVHPNPRGDMDMVWATLENDADSGADGGFHTPTVKIDKTKKYRFSVWVRRENVGNGRTYFGLNAYNTSGGETGLVNLTDTTDTHITNPYFTSFMPSEVNAANDNWVLMVSYMHPNSTTSTTSDATNGLYKQDGIKVKSIAEFKWSSTASTVRLRAYLYYSTSTKERQYFYRPRIDLCDGSEPSIKELLSCNEHVPLVDSSGVYKPRNLFSIGKNGDVYSTEFIEV